MFTIGDKETYDDILSQDGEIFKLGKTNNYEGGYAFETYEQAKEYMEKESLDFYDIYNLHCSLEDTILNDKGYRNLLVDSLITKI